MKDFLYGAGVTHISVSVLGGLLSTTVVPELLVFLKGFSVSLALPLMAPFALSYGFFQLMAIVGLLMIGLAVAGGLAYAGLKKKHNNTNLPKTDSQSIVFNLTH